MTDPPYPPLDLDNFLPFRLSVLTNMVSGAIARLYRRRFGITVAEWRVLAVLGRSGGMSANSVAERTAMDKVRVSRAVGRLLRRGLVERDLDARDRRRSRLSLSAAGQAAHDRIVPSALEIEADLLAALTPRQKAALDEILARLQARAADLAARGDFSGRD